MSPLAAIARLRAKARQCRRAAFGMEPSLARSALERLAARWEVMARAEQQGVIPEGVIPQAANEP